MINIIERAVLTAAQKTGTLVATKVITSMAATFAGCIIQSNIMKAKQKELQEKAIEKANNGEMFSEEEIKKEQMNAFTSAAVATGVVSGAGLLANNAIANVVKNL